MRHAREDYNRIQDPAGLIPAKEPVMLIRGQDKHAPDILAYQLLRYAKDPEVSEEMCLLVVRQIREIQDWHAHVQRKSPDLPGEAQ